MKTALAKRIHKRVRTVVYNVLYIYWEISTDSLQLTKKQLRVTAKKMGKRPKRGISKNKLSCMVAGNKKCTCG